MDTIEHTELGDALRIANINANPYLRVDESGVLHLRLQRFGDNNLPEPMDLELSAGEVIAMAGDYFTQADWTLHLKLPKCERFESSVELGKRLINSPVTQEEASALITAYNNLAAPDVTRTKINRIYTINSANYIPFSSTLNSYAQQIMLLIRVKNYGEMIIRNQTHFTPWSIKVYVLGHTIALRYARLSHELMKLAQDSNYQSDNSDLLALKTHFAKQNQIPTKESLIELAHRYQAQAYSIELFTFHYFSDHFATGHMSVVGILRVTLQERFGTWGSILANNLHDEVNRIGLYTHKPYDPSPDATDAPTRSRGDGKFNSCLNQFNRTECIAGMNASLNDINNVLNGSEIPVQNKFGGLEHMPDVDFKTRQHQPLLVLSKKKIYYRTDPSEINIISPSEYEALRVNPEEHGYTELTSKWEAFKLVAKLRLFPYAYNGTVLPVSSEKMAQILLDEQQRSPQRQPIPDPLCTPEAETSVLDWRSRETAALGGLKQHGVFAFNQEISKDKNKEELPELTFSV